MPAVFKPAFDITNRIASALTRIERARGFLEAARLSEDWLQAMRQRAFVLEAHHTTHIEGTRLTLEQSTRALGGQPLPEANPDDVRELLNYKEAFALVSEYLDDGGTVTEGLIREIHKRLVAGVRGGAAAPGEYRAIQNYVANSATGKIIYTPPLPCEVPVLMKEFVGWLNNEMEIHPVLLAGIAQFQLVHIHPFIDGNGRTSRLLSTLCLYRRGYDFKRLFTISEFYDRDRRAFYGAIQSVRESGMNMTGWLEYFVDGLGTQLAEVQERGRLVISKDILAKKHELSERQTRVLSLAMEQSDFTIQDVENTILSVSRRTLQRDLKILMNKGLLVSRGDTSKLIYRLKSND